MPRGHQPQSGMQLVKALVIGDGKCGKSDWAARSAEAGFNVLYLDGDVGSQTIHGLPKDKKNPVSMDVMERIFIMDIKDELINGGLNYRMVNFMRKFTTAAEFNWNDSQQREFTLTLDGEHTEDEIWSIRPAKMDHTCVAVIDSWTSLAQSALNWACDEAGLDPGEIEESERGKMRSVYQAAGEKLTQYLIMIRSWPCHVIVIAHPREFTKTEKKVGASVAQKESDMKVLWTKMVPASSSNNHAFTMAKYFTDIAWLEVNMSGEYKIDYRPDNSKLSGSHLNAILDTRGPGSFAELVKHIGGVIPGETQPFDHWLTIHSDGFDAPTGKKAKVILGAQNPPAEGAPASVKGVTAPGKLNLGKR